MNRLILKYAYPITVVILVVLAWVVYRRAAHGWAGIAPLAIAAIVVWLLGAPTFILVWPRITVSGFRRALVRPGGFGGTAVPVNTLYADPRAPSGDAPTDSLLATGTDHLLYVGGWLDLRRGALVLHTPDMGGRYYSVQFIDPASQATVASVGTRTTGDDTRDVVIARRGWAGTVPAGMTRITVPAHSALVIGRVYVGDETDRPAAYALAQRLRVTPLGD